MSVPGSISTVGNISRQHAHPFLLEDLPDEAVVLLSEHTSSPSTPDACLLPLVCRSWQAVVSRVQPLVDIRLDLAPSYKLQQHGTAALETSQSLLHGHTTAAAAMAALEAAAVAAAAALAAAGESPKVLRGGQLAAWLAKHRGSVRSLCILSIESTSDMNLKWERDLASIRDILTVPQHSPPGALVLPHLVRLELPVLGLPGSSGFLQALAGCTSLQQLTLKQARGVFDPDAEEIDMEALAKAVAPLFQLRVLHVDIRQLLRPVVLAGLLWALPPSLEEMQLEQLLCFGSIPLSCFTHLVNLRAWELPEVQLVGIDSNSSSSSSSSSRTGGACPLTALTRLHVGVQLDSSDARLQLPNLRALHLEDMKCVQDPAVWQQLQGMPSLQQLTACLTFGKGIRDGYARSLGEWTRLQQLQLRSPGWYESMEEWKPWAAAVACHTNLRALHVPGQMVVVGGVPLLAVLGHLKELTVDCIDPLRQQPDPVKAQKVAASMANVAVQVVAAAVRGGKAPPQLQRLVLLAAGAGVEPGAEVQQVVAAAQAAMRMLKVQAA